MKNTLNYLGVLVIGIIIGIVCSIVVRSHLTNPIRTVTDTMTVITHDTVRITEPQAKKIIPVEVRKFTTVPTLLTIPDTIKVPYYVRDTLMIPIEQRYYTTDAYKAWVSGYMPKLDSIMILAPTKTVTIENTRENTAQNQLYLSANIQYIHPFPAMSIGLQAGYNRDRWGLSIGTGGIVTPSGLKWYGQVGLEYDLFTKKW